MTGSRWFRWPAMARMPGGDAGAGSSTGRRDTVRLVAFSDGVFAISITLLVLEIKPPTDYGHLLHGLAVLWPSYVAYALTFLFIGQVWVNHHVMFDHVRAADRVVLFLNTLLLMVAPIHLSPKRSPAAASLDAKVIARVGVVYRG